MTGRSEHLVSPESPLRSLSLEHDAEAGVGGGLQTSESPRSKPEWVDNEVYLTRVLGRSPDLRN